MSYGITQMQDFKKNDTNEFIYKKEIDPQTQETNLQSPKGEEAGGGIY